MFHRVLIPAALVASALTAQADEVFNDDVIAIGKLCAGVDCALNESFVNETVRIKSSVPEIRFIDTSSDNDDWYFDINAGGGEDFFEIFNVTRSSRPFRIDGGAPSSALHIGAQGNIGIGTALPTATVDIQSDVSPTLRMKSVGSFPSSWVMVSASNSFIIGDEIGGGVPLVLENGAPAYAFVVDATGNIGMGTQDPVGQLELSSDAAFNFFRITATGAAVNDSVDITFTGGPLGTGQLRYNIVDGDNQEMSLDADGNMVLDGTLTTAGPACAAGCDRVFDADYALPSIQDHAKAMFAQRHLPGVGPTLPGAPINMTEKMGNMLNALEHAHIYIAQQQDQMDQQAAHIARLERKLDDLIASR